MPTLLRPPTPGHEFPLFNPDLPTLLITTGLLVALYLIFTKRTKKIWPVMALSLLGVIDWILVSSATWQTIGFGVIAAIVVSAFAVFLIEVLDHHCRN